MAGALTAAIAAAFSGGGAPVATDPYFEYTTLLLPGNGTNGAQNNTFLDGSTNNFTITRNGNTTQGTFSPFSQTGWGNYFDGTNDNLSVSSSTDLAAGSGAFTIEAWVFTADTSFMICASQTSAGLGFGYNIDNGSQGLWLGRVAVGVDATSGVQLTYNQWNHVAVTRDASNNVKFFVNGTQSGSTATVTTNYGTSAQGLYVGLDQNGTTFPFAGYISNLRYIKGQSILGTATSFTVPTSPLTSTTVGWSGTGVASSITGTVSLLTCQSNRFVDNSTTPKTITANNGVQVVAFSPFNPTASWSAATYGGSGYFDGSGDYLSLTIGSTTIGSGDFTIELWYYPITLENYDSLFSTTRGANGFNIGVNASRTVVWYSSSAEQINAGTVTQYAWNHIAFTRTSNTLRLYVNGSQVGATPTVSTNFSATNCWIGDLSAIGGEPSNGYMSGLRVVTQSLASGSTYTVPTAPLTAITNTSLLLNFTNAGIYDATSKNDLETLDNTVNGVRISTATSQFGGSSIYFDGTGTDYLWIQADQPIQRFGTAPFTIELWIRLAATGSARGLVAKGTSTTGWLVSLNSSNQVVFTYGTSTITSTGTISANVWTYIAVVREGTGANQTKIYIGGSNDGTGTVSTDFTQTSSMYIGANRTGGDLYSGYIQDVRITNGYARTVTTVPTSAFPTL
jgi:hypothetical protein